MKNTFFWFAAILFVVGVIGLVTGEKSILDPGQRRENGLVWIYFLASLIMAVNGYLSHRMTLKEMFEDNE